MSFQDDLEELQCAYSDFKHFLIDPITLSNCGHSVCKNCLPNDKTCSIKCKICNIVTEQDFSKIQTSKALKQALKLCLSNIFEVIENETTLKLDELKSIIKIKLSFILYMKLTFSYLKIFIKFKMRI